MKTKGAKKHIEAHTSTTGSPFGDYYGTGEKAKIGKMRSPMVGVNPLSGLKLKKPPKSLA